MQIDYTIQKSANNTILLSWQWSKQKLWTNVSSYQKCECDLILGSKICTHVRSPTWWHFVNWVRSVPQTSALHKHAFVYSNEKDCKLRMSIAYSYKCIICLNSISKKRKKAYRILFAITVHRFEILDIKACSTHMYARIRVNMFCWRHGFCFHEKCTSTQNTCQFLKVS